MTTVAFTIAAVAVLGPTIYVIVRYASPAEPLARFWTSVRATPRLAVYPPPPRRAGLPSIAILAEGLNNFPWESQETPILAEQSAHANHGWYPKCGICRTDPRAIATAALKVIDEYLARPTEAELDHARNR